MDTTKDDLLIDEESLNRPWSRLDPRQKDIHIALSVYFEKVILLNEEPHWMVNKNGINAWDPLPHFSTNANDALALVRDIANSEIIFEIRVLKMASGIMYRVIITDGEEKVMVLEHTLPEAVCRCIKEFLDGPEV